MRKIASLLTVSMFFCSLAFGQPRQVTGTVRDANGAPVPFATVTEAGTRNAVTADANGNFTIRVPENARLTISSTGFTATTVAVTDATNVLLARNANAGQLDEVVVTALGIRKKAKEVGYATSRVNPDQITAGRATNIGQALSGKVSGLQIANTSSSVNQAPRITLRGLRSITGDNTALIVLDGVPVPANTINYLNPNDVERVDVLKGGQAATLFGSEGVNGAIVITTKKGTGRPEITVTHSSNIESVAYLPKMQDEFGSGSAYGGNRSENFNSVENQQYGDRYDGSMRGLGRVLVDGSQQVVPYSNIKDARKQLWNRGYTAQTDFSYRAGDAASNFFASYQNLHTDGIVYGDSYNRNVFRLNAGRTYGKINVGFDATYTWDKSDRTNSDFYFFALNTASWIPIGSYRDWRNNKFADPNGYFNDYYNNPWWEKDNDRFTTRNNFFNGNVRLVFKPISSVEVTARVGIASTNGTTETFANRFDYTEYAKSGAFFGNFNSDYLYLNDPGRYDAANNPVNGSFGEGFSRGTRTTADLFASYRKEFNKISLSATGGFTGRESRSETFNTSTNGILTAGLVNASNAATSQFVTTNSNSTTRKISGFAEATVGYNNYIFLHGSFRRDYTSVFYSPEVGFNQPAYNTYGGDVSFVVTDAFPSIRNRVLDNLKLRVSYNRNGNDNLGAQLLQTTLVNSSGFPYSGLAGYTQSGTLVQPGIHPEVVKTGEVGLEAGFFKNRVTFEASYYNQRSNEQIIPIQISNASGFQNLRLNAADLKNWGMEFDVKANVYRNKNWSVSVNGNYSQNHNEVVDLAGANVDRLTLQSTSHYSVDAQKGTMFPYLRTDAFMRDPEGHVVIDTTNGWPRLGADLVGQGTTTPIHILGLGMNVSFKSFTLIANAEYRGGNVIYNNLGSQMNFTGSGAQTTIYERQVFVWPNSVYQDASGKYITNTNVAVSSRWATHRGYGDIANPSGFANIGEILVSSGAFWKLRDVSLAYELPKSVVGGLKVVRGINLSIWARNLVTILPKDNWWTDPELSNTSGNSQGVNNTLNTPPTRQIGGTLRVNF
ncbi:SusC/RagA family TonB-linked outer membrane protein [Flaviaesturariibacter flavus]|uniref:SusC/RagA family TonB-linked outer membrane protein n=1 Tax=Flaviaesturariibacter flavus TaxID=2502780 RepID=A0A4R1B995_9BACT|nr:SusC/RagA family TonB-linked outer membrane protein [Flaviaesturariibacter flavus]TCJ13393.1 SusC/RagA family TonB-linked outer membrane protein [Flaviaesturariibacter flavus]